MKTDECTAVGSIKSIYVFKMTKREYIEHFMYLDLDSFQREIYLDLMNEFKKRL